MSWREFRPNDDGATGAIVEHTTDQHKNAVTVIIEKHVSVSVWELYLRDRYDLRIYGAQYVGWGSR